MTGPEIAQKIMLDLKHKSNWPEIMEIHRDNHHIYAHTNDRIIHIVVRTEDSK
jgi:hypothetical protein